MSDVFGPVYASAYDALYADKDYERECDLLEQAFRRYGAGSLRCVLDLGCGTGGHALALARRGYRVTGVDRSEAMLACARSKAGDTSVSFYCGDIESVRAGGPYDAAAMMFAVLGYLADHAAVLRALRTAREHLRPGGLLVFDVWYGPAVLAQRPGERCRLIDEGASRVLRVASGELDVLHQVCTVRYRLWRMRERAVLDETNEEHRVRFFFPGELRLLLDAAGLALCSLSAFPMLDRAPDESSWSALVVARAVE